MKRYALFIFAWAVALCSVHGANFESAFEAGNTAYAKGDFKGAVDSYKEAVSAGGRSANLFFNLGNAEFRLQREGDAILNYERALILAPAHPEALANLEFVRNKAGSVTNQPGFLERSVAKVSFDTWTLISACSGWVALVALVLLWTGRGGPWGILAVLGILVAGVSGFAAITQRGDLRAAIILEPVAARVAPADSADSLAKLSAGSRVELLRINGDWAYCKLPNQGRGWIPAKLAPMIREIP